MKLIKYICILFRTLLIIYTKKVHYDTRVSFYTSLVIYDIFTHNIYIFIDFIMPVKGHNKKFIRLTTERIKEECDAKQIIKLNKKWNKDYKKQGYRILSREEIYDIVCKILDK
jgi:hypothetical protein